MKKLKRISALAAAVLALSAMVACSSSQFASKPPDDAALTAHVKARLAGDSGASASHVDVAVKNRFVTLTGTVPNKEAHQEAMDVAGRTDGVLGVIDHLKVQGTKG